MFYSILVCLILILAFSLLVLISQICKINKQIEEKRNVRVSLSNRHIEKLAGLLNEKDRKQKQAELQILQSEDKLKQSVSNISHDLRTPLTSIKGYLTLLEETDDLEEQKKYIHILQAKSEYLTSLVQEFYELSVIENRDFNVQLEKVDLNRVVTDVLLDKYKDFSERQPQIEITDKPVCVVGNDVVCRRIIENLLTNALKYAEGVISLSLDDKGTFKIKNSTATLSGKDVEYLFEKFYTADPARSCGSTGLGLYIVKGLLEKINGGIEYAEYKDGNLIISIFFSLCE